MFGFVNPWLLLFGLAVAVPIAVHLFNFHKFKRVYFTNVSMLKQVIAQTKKQSRLRNLLLLAARVALVLLLVLFFASPFLKEKGDTLVGKGKNYVVICLDNTFSMQNQGSEGRLLDEAKRKAKEIVNQYKNSDEFLLLTSDMDGRTERFVSRERFLQMLDEKGQIEITPCTQPDSYILKRAYTLLESKSSGSKRCFFISDCQQKSFDASEFPRQEDVKTLFVPLQAQNISNIYIDSIGFDNPIFGMAEPINMVARLVNSSKEEAKGVSVKLFVSGKQVAVTSIDIPKQSSINTRISFSLEHKGINHCRLSVLDSPVTFDDNFYFTLQTDKVISVLEINGKSAAEGNKYLSRLFSQSSEVSFHQWSEQSIDYNSLTDYSLIILNELSQLTPSLTQALQRYRQKNGTILIIPAKEMDIPSFRNGMSALRIPSYSSMIPKENKVSVVNQQSRIYKGVFATKVDNMQMPKAEYYWSFASLSPVSKESVMSFSTGEDFLVLSKENNSSVYLFASPLRENATDFVKQALFVPTVWNMALFAQVLWQPYYFLNTLQPIDISFIKDKDFANVKVIKLSTLNKHSSFIPQYINNNQRQCLMLHSSAKEAANYDIIGDDKVYGGLSLNYPRQESDLSFFSPSQIKALLKQNKLTNYGVLQTRRQRISSYFAKHDNSFLFSWIIFALLSIAIASETIILIRQRKNIS